jgi:hypothetical protein
VILLRSEVKTEETHTATQLEVIRPIPLADSLVSQFCPVQPGRHVQKYPPIRFRQGWAFSQGFCSHSSASGEGQSEGKRGGGGVATTQQKHRCPCICVMFVCVRESSM